MENSSAKALEGSENQALLQKDKEIRLHHPCYTALNQQKQRECHARCHPTDQEHSQVKYLGKDKLSYEEGKPGIKLLIFRLMDNLLYLMSHSRPNSKVIVKL